jgi:DNA topoisomerase-3
MATAKSTASTPFALPELDDGEMATLTTVSVRERKTRPPSAYTEGLLLDDMRAAAKFVEGDSELKKVLKDVSGLGTAATRDSIIEGLKHDKYLEKSGKYLVATPKGLAFIQWLDKIMPELTDVAVTARWEAELSVVAQKGGGAAFESRIAETVRKLISTLKAAPPLGLPAKPFSSTSKKDSSMTDTNEPRKSTPTDKMLEYAKNIATRVNVRVPDDVMTDFEACKAFIDLHKDAAMRPSDKQLNFANSIAERKGLTVPAEVSANGKELSKWIDENK